MSIGTARGPSEDRRPPQEGRLTGPLASGHVEDQTQENRTGGWAQAEPQGDSQVGSPGTQGALRTRVNAALGRSRTLHNSVPATPDGALLQTL